MLAILIALCFDMVGPVYQAATAALTGGPACKVGLILEVQLVGQQCFIYQLDELKYMDRPPLLVRKLKPLLDEISTPGIVLMPYVLLLVVVGLILFKLRGPEILEALGVRHYHLEEIRRLS